MKFKTWGTNINQSFNYNTALSLIAEYCYYSTTLNPDRTRINLDIIFYEANNYKRRVKLINKALRNWNNKSTKQRIRILKKFENQIKLK